jgi:hypothetical protein
LQPQTFPTVIALQALIPAADFSASIVSAMQNNVTLSQTRRLVYALPPSFPPLIVSKAFLISGRLSLLENYA